MNKIITLFFIFFSLFALSQEKQKRLALVIGNANYEIDPLDNPVNDALLIANTLKKLSFDVILDTNVSTDEEMEKLIIEFGKKRNKYDVGFVYYAGHAVQLNSTNYLLPTKEQFNDEIDVQYNAVAVSSIIDFLMKRTNQMNVLILDACRNNPFEKNWNKTRSIGNSSGLAPMQAPLGTLIAFSTIAGETAPDGLKNSKNSTYCKYLAEYMMIPGINIEQVFRRVRSSVYEATGQTQITEESTQLTGEEDFYLVPTSFENEYLIIDSLMREGENIHLFEAMELVGSILKTEKNNQRALLVKAEIFQKQSAYDKSIEAFNKCVKLYPNNPKIYKQKGLLLQEMKKYDDAINIFNQCINLDTTYYLGYYHKAETYYLNNKYNEGIISSNQAILTDSLNTKAYLTKAKCYYSLEEYENSLFNYTKCIELEPSSFSFNNRAEFYYEKGYETNNAADYELSIKDYNKAIEIGDSDWQIGRAINGRANVYWQQKKWELCIQEYTKYIELLGTAVGYSNRGRVYMNYLNQQDKALIDLNKAIELDPEDVNYYIFRADCYYNIGDYQNALLDYSKCIELEPSSFSFNNRADFYYDKAYETNNAADYELAIKDYNKAIEIGDNDWQIGRAITGRANVYSEQGKWELCIEEYTKVIELNGDAIGYGNRGLTYLDLKNYEMAIADFTKAIELDPEDVSYYSNRADCYYNLGDYQNALLDYSKRIELEPSSFSYDIRAEFYYEKGYETNNAADYELAIKDYNKAIEIGDSDRQIGRAINGRANVYWQQKKWELCIQEYTKYIELLGDAVGYSNRGRVYMNYLNQQDKALIDLNKAIELDPEDVNYYKFRADCYYNLGDYQNALLDYSKCIELEPSSSRFNNRAKFYYEKGYETNNTADYELAIKDYNKAIEIGDSDWQIRRAINGRANVYSEQGKWELCIEEYTKVIELNGDALGYSNRGLTYLDLKNYEMAIADFTKAIELDPEKVSYYSNRAKCYDNIGDYQNALLDYSKCIELEPSSYRFNNRAEFYYQKGYETNNAADYELAIKDYNKAIEIGDNDWQIGRAFNGRANVYWQQKKWELCIQEYTKFIELLGTAVGYSNRGRVYMNYLNQQDKALIDLNKAIELDPEDVSHYSNRADCYYNLGDYQNALLDYSKCIELEPSSFSFNNRAEFYYEKGYETNKTADYELAIKDYNKAIEIGDSDWQIGRAINGRANVYSVQGKWELCIEEYTKYIELSGNAIGYGNRGLTYIELKNYEMAIADFTKAIELDPEKVSYYSNRADCYYNLEDYQNALLDYSKCIELEPSSYRFNNRAKFYYEKGYETNNTADYELAIKDYNKAIEIGDSDWQIRRAINGRANVYSEQGKWELCIEEYTKYIELLGTAVGYSNRGLTYLDLKNYEMAIADFTKAIELVPEKVSYYSNRADCYDNIGDYQNALLDYSKCIELEPSSYHFNNRADFYYDKAYETNNTADYELAIKDYNKAIEIGDSDWQIGRAITGRANVYSVQGKWELSIEEYTKNIELHGDALAYSNRGLTYVDLKNYEMAIADFTKAIELDPEKVSYYSVRANCYDNIGDYQNALLDYSKRIELEPSSFSYGIRAEFFWGRKKYDSCIIDHTYAINIGNEDDQKRHTVLRGYVYSKIGDFKNAILDFNKIILLDDEYDLAYLYRAKMFTMQNEYEKAKNDLFKVIEISPKKPRAYYFLANHYNNFNKYFQAIAYYDKAIQRMKNNQKIYDPETNTYINKALIHIKKGEIYKNQDLNDMMCDCYKEACDEGECDIYDKNCKK